MVPRFTQHQQQHGQHLGARGLCDDSLTYTLGPATVPAHLIQLTQFTPPPQTMRKIESQMNAAILEGRNFSSGNTTVTHEDGVAIVTLYGNKIAVVGDSFLTLFDGGRQSDTTKSRLNAILSGNGNGTEKVFQKNRKWFISYDGITEPFESGALLG